MKPGVSRRWAFLCGHEKPANAVGVVGSGGSYAALPFLRSLELMSSPFMSKMSGLGLRFRRVSLALRRFLAQFMQRLDALRLDAAQSGNGWLCALQAAKLPALLSMCCLLFRCVYCVSVERVGGFLHVAVYLWCVAAMSDKLPTFSYQHRLIKIGHA